MAVFRLSLDAADVGFIDSNAGIQFLFDYICVHLFSVNRCLVLMGVVGALEPLPAVTGRSPVQQRALTPSALLQQPPIN